ncbi:MAG: helix-turn-helix domain-containing protein [Synergistaceae bacterium]|jgi:transcriptional regulator with XRE-family HTH domain|nr:helix-turn-helix domain-containing protein [Synergistaceae bacterium]
MKGLAILMSRHGDTMAKLADAMDVNLNTVWRWRVGQNAPSLEIQRAICERYGCTHDELLNGPAKNELKFNIVWEVDEMNMIDVPNNEVFLGFKPHFNVVAGAFPDDADPDEIGRRISNELRAARVARDARQKVLAGGEGA